MLISGIQPFSILDYPNKTSCILFTAGCNFRCGYCHNPEFVLPEQIRKIRDSFIPEKAFFRFLDERRGLLDGVVMSGGEPTLQHDLERVVEAIKQKQFLVKLDTNGNRPQVIAQLQKKNLIDYIAMDIKTGLSDYADLAGARASMYAIQESVLLLMKGKIEYEFRSTIIADYHTEKRLRAMGELISGAKILYLQTFRPVKTLDPFFRRMKGFTKVEMQQIADDIFCDYVEKVIVRD